MSFGGINCNFKMSRAFIIVAVVAFAHLSRANCFKFSIARNLSGIKEIEQEKWCHVEVIQNGNTENDIVTVKVDIPRDLPFSDVYIFFASDTKEILHVILSQPIMGKYYAAPYKFIKEMKGGNAVVTENGNFIQVSGDIPNSWLPKNSTKISATVKDNNDGYYNYYGIQNFIISLPDLMVVEEFRSF